MLPQVKLNDFIHAVSIPDTVEWNRSRGFRRVFFETLYFSNQKSFSLDLQSNPAISKSQGK